MREPTDDFTLIERVLVLRAMTIRAVELMREESGEVAPGSSPEDTMYSLFLFEAFQRRKAKLSGKHRKKRLY